MIKTRSNTASVHRRSNPAHVLQGIDSSICFSFCLEGSHGKNSKQACSWSPPDRFTWWYTLLYTLCGSCFKARLFAAVFAFAFGDPRAFAFAFGDPCAFAFAFGVPRAFAFGVPRAFAFGVPRALAFGPELAGRAEGSSSSDGSPGRSNSSCAADLNTLLGLIFRIKLAHELQLIPNSKNILRRGSWINGPMLRILAHGLANDCSRTHTNSQT